MSKNVLDVGNCGPDHATLQRFLEQHFDVIVHQADQLEDTLALLARQPIDLILVNRKLDIDYSDGTAVVAAIKQDKRFRTIPAMLITNYEEHQQAAMALGAELGFGKLQLQDPATRAKLAKFLA